MGVFLSISSQAHAGSGPNLPAPEKIFYILDTSSSSDSGSLWTNNLRPSLIQKLSKPFGMVKNKNTPARQPVDISLGLITSRSRSEKIYRFTKYENAKNLWALLWRDSGDGNPARVEQMSAAFFGDVGTVTSLVEEYLLVDEVKVPTTNACITKAASNLGTQNYVKNFPLSKRQQYGRAMCSVVSDITKQITIADRDFENLPTCRGYCSDVVGAIAQANGAASDLSHKNPSSKMCIGIASDMLNNYPGIDSNSPLFTSLRVKNSKTESEARAFGIAAAQKANIRFPKNVSVRVEVMNFGADLTDGFSQEKLSLLWAYWQGFFKQAGAYRFNQALSEACI